MNDGRQIIKQAETELKQMSADDCILALHTNGNAADALDTWLVRSALGTTDLTDPDYNAWMLLHAAVDRAVEATLSLIAECDEDHCYPLEHQYRDRVATFRRELTDIATQPTPLGLAMTSQYNLGGLPQENTRRGAKLPAVCVAWAEVRSIVADTYPTELFRSRWNRMSAPERAVAMAHR